MEKCVAYERCGACQGLGTPYAGQLAWKRDAVARAFRSEGLRVQVQDVCGMEEPFHYRNKVIAAVSMRGSRVVCGLYEESSHRVVPMAGCLLQDERLNAVLETIESLLNSLKIRPYGYGGTLKHLLLRLGARTGEILLVLVTSEELMHGRKELLARLRSAHPEIKTVVQNIQPRQTSVVLGEREKVLFGPGYIFDELLGLRYKISARSFYQINPSQTGRLYAKALSLAALRPDGRLMDAYCGIGTIGLSAASADAIQVVGVEINRDAVRDAIANARANGIRNARFHCADVSAFMREFDEAVDVLMLDPPRAGCDEDFLRSVLRLAPARIVYVSCNPVTQARDVAYLTGGRRPAYKLASDAWPFDLFPHTTHVENVIALTR
jgi:23S rRNA (uracil1939-C5)-methyltransferase